MRYFKYRDAKNAQWEIYEKGGLAFKWAISEPLTLVTSCVIVFVFEWLETISFVLWIGDLFPILWPYGLY